jgi:hypothetical protein
MLSLLFGGKESRTFAIRVFWGIALALVVSARFWPNNTFARATGTCFMVSFGSVDSFKRCMRGDPELASYTTYASYDTGGYDATYGAAGR